MNVSEPFILRPVGNHAVDGGDHAVRLRRLHVPAAVDVARSRLSDDPGADALSGASPEVMTSSVTAPLERQFGQMPGLNQMTSASSAGASVITLQFSLDLSLDVAEQEVQAAINAAGNLLPSDLPTPPIYAKVNPADAPILTLAVTSKTLPLTDLEDYERDPARAENLAADRRRPRQHQRRPAAGGAHSGQSAGARRLWAQHRRRPHHASAISTSTRRRAISTARRRL